MPSRIFVTGGAGFIGSHVVDQCLARGHEVLVYDNFSRGKEEFLQMNHAALHVQKGDILDAKAIEKALKGYQPTHLIHLAALHYIPYCNEHPEETIDVNVKGTEIVLRAAAGLKPGVLQKVIVTSSAAVYPPSEELHDEGDAMGPTDIYGFTKYCNEMQAQQFHRLTSVPTVIARIFNAYGTRETNPHLIPEIISQMKKGKTTMELGNMTTKRSYIYVKDLARGLVDLLEGEKTGVCEPYNIGSKAEYNAKELVELLSDASGKKIAFTSVAARQRKSDRPRLQPSLKKIEKTVGWKEKYTMEEGLREILREEPL